MKRACLIIILSIICLASQAAAEDCLMCHPNLKEGKSVHAAVSMGCATCHTGIDASTMPHKVTSEFSKGLSAQLPDICYNCHDKTKFYGPTIHAPVGIGLCTACHNPHRSDSEKLLTSVKTELCFNCHDKAAFSKRSVHKPANEGKCLDCHKPHVSQNEALLIRKGNSLCTKCHPKVLKNAHAVAGFKRSGHPLRGRKDPNRPGKTFECLSCHVPHASDYPSLYRYKAETMFDLCNHCHEF